MTRKAMFITGTFWHTFVLQNQKNVLYFVHVSKNAILVYRKKETKRM